MPSQGALTGSVILSGPAQSTPDALGDLLGAALNEYNENKLIEYRDENFEKCVEFY